MWVNIRDFCRHTSINFGLSYTRLQFISTIFVLFYLVCNRSFYGHFGRSPSQDVSDGCRMIMIRWIISLNVRISEVKISLRVVLVRPHDDCIEQLIRLHSDRNIEVLKSVSGRIAKVNRLFVGRTTKVIRLFVGRIGWSQNC